MKSHRMIKSSKRQLRKEHAAMVEHKPDPVLRDTEQVPLLHEGGIQAFIRREVLPYAPDAWYVPGSVKIGYEIFASPATSTSLSPWRTLGSEIRADHPALCERETEGLLARNRGDLRAPRRTRCRNSNDCGHG